MKPVRCRALVEFRFGPVEDDPYMFSVTAALRIGLAAFLQLALPIHPGGVEQVIAERLLLEFCDHQRLVEKTCQAGAEAADGAHHKGSSLRREAAVKHRQPAQPPWC